MNQVSVHIYKYSQDSRRRKLRKMKKEGLIKMIRKTKTHFYYEVPPESMSEYIRRCK